MGQTSPRNAPADGVVAVAHRHGDRRPAERRDDPCRGAGAADLHALEVLELAHRRLGVQEARAVGVQVHDLDLVELLGLELLVEGVDEPGGGQSRSRAQGQVEHLEQREAAPRVGEDRHADVGDALHDAVIALVRRGEGPAVEQVDLDLAVGPLLDLLGPLRREDAVAVRGREEDRVVQPGLAEAERRDAQETCEQQAGA